MRHTDHNLLWDIRHKEIMIYYSTINHNPSCINVILIKSDTQLLFSIIDIIQNAYHQWKILCTTYWVCIIAVCIVCIYNYKYNQGYGGCKCDLKCTGKNDNTCGCDDNCNCVCKTKKEESVSIIEKFFGG